MRIDDNGTSVLVCSCRIRASVIAGVGGQEMIVLNVSVICMHQHFHYKTHINS